MNVFDVLNSFYREDVISDFLVSCFKESEEFLLKFLHEAYISIDDGTEFVLDTRVGLGKSIGTPDLIVKAVHGNRTKLIVVENKMGAAEGHEQTNRYVSMEAKVRLANKYQLDIDHTEFHYIFLALDTTVRPRNSQFIFLNYDLFLKDGWTLHHEKLRMVFEDFKLKLHHFYTPLRKPINSLETGMEMDRIQRKICWQKILAAAFSLKSELILDWGDVAGAGRHNFIFLISKSGWTSERPFQHDGIARTFNVHVDTYINMLNNQKGLNEIGIRFETYPYEPYQKVKHLPNYDAFIENKRIFGEELINRVKRNGLHARPKSSRLLVMTVPIEGHTVDDQIHHMKHQVELLERCIDDVVNDMKSRFLII
ncbi:hypothetical protein N781_16150 [Pontibacillus halophilus JSM 076056 = DSM 19796]|uniref:PD-(D/E)XK nuclease superfamily protein n=1 Tax=Pontibacillus halophilus JSM 076056 = DSM 19796 TaxID=1385510 RepID=A0A0A5GKH5_9BACI|nr:PD-(D/E)XK nuclease family protein [Pontibacillus halophilus]KGX92474.1 hypothetical protein N781_16150 [Pontibacillus halophilus JSM 076056 = DSM 19796]